MRRFTHLLAVFAFFALSPVSSANNDITQYFGNKLNKINQFLADNHKQAVSQPNLLMDFVDKELLKVWSAKNTIRAMLGPARWKQLTKAEAEQLIAAYETTIHRYLFEVLQKYQGQKAQVNGLRLNSKGNKGWLKVTLQSPSLPDFDVDLKIYRESTTWTVYDFSFQGISFVNMKRGFFRNTFDSDGVEGVIEKLNKKNQKFKKVLAAAS